MSTRAKSVGRAVGATVLVTALLWVGAPARGLLADETGDPLPPPPAGAAPTPSADAPPPGPAAAEPRPRRAGGTPDLSDGRTIDLTLGRAVRMALAANLTLQAGRLDPTIARAAYQAEVAAFDTLLSASFELEHLETPATSAFFGRTVVEEDSASVQAGLSRRLRSGGEVSFLYQADRLDTNSLFVTLDPSWTQRGVVEVTKPLLRGAGDVAVADIRRASNATRAASHGQRALEEQILLSVAEGYWNLVFAQENVRSLRKSEEVARELLQDAQARLDARVGTPLDVAEARAGLQLRRGERITAEGERDAAADRLRALILPFDRSGSRGAGLRAIDDPRAAGGMHVDVDELDRYVQAALQTRPEICASRADLANRAIDVHVAADAVKPQLDAFARGTLSGLDGDYGGSLEETLTAQATSAAVGLRFSMFIGQRAARAGLRIAHWANRQAVIRHQELENQVVVEVRAAARRVATAQARLDAAAVEVEAAEEALQGERDRLGQGKATPFRVLEKEELLTAARTREERAATDLRIARAAFWRAVGMLAEQLGVARSSAGR